MAAFETSSNKIKGRHLTSSFVAFEGCCFLHEGEGVAWVEVGHVGVHHDGDEARRGQRFPLHRPEPGTGDC